MRFLLCSSKHDLYRFEERGYAFQVCRIDGYHPTDNAHAMTRDRVNSQSAMTTNTTEPTVDVRNQKMYRRTCRAPERHNCEAEPTNWVGEKNVLSLDNALGKGWTSEKKKSYVHILSWEGSEHKSLLC